MSALEKALRQIDEQRQTPSRAAPLPSMMPLPSEPLLTHSLLRWAPVGLMLLLTAAAGGGGYWLYRSGTFSGLVGQANPVPAVVNTAQPTAPLAGNEVNTPTPPLTQAAQTSAAPVAQWGKSSDSTATPPLAPSELASWERPQGFDAAVLAWTSGQHAQAGRLWINALRRLPPSTMAVLLADQQTAEQVNNVVLSHAAALPWLAIPSPSSSGERWAVLVLTPPADLDRAYAWLARSGGPALQWGTIAHWVAASDSVAQTPSSAPASLGSLTPSAKAQIPPVTSPTAAAPARSSAPLPAKPSTVAPIAAVTPIPSLPARNTGQGSAAASTVTNAPLAAAATPTAPRTETPQVSRSAAGETGTLADSSAPSAARSIENEFAAIEQELSAARYDSALGRVGKLEENIGANWRTRYLTGVALSGLMRWREAVSILSLARQGNPAHSRVALYLSVAQQELGQHEAAIDTLTQALGSHGDMPELWLNKAHSLQALGRGEEAAFTYRRFLDLSSNRQDLSQQRSWVQKLLDRKGSAW